MNSKVCRFVCFTGIDGAGKTTLARSVVNALWQGGLEAEYAYTPIDVKLLKPFWVLGRLLFARGENRERDYVHFSSTKRANLSRYPILIYGYKALLMMEYAPQIIRRLVVPLWLGKCIVSDRYIYDTMLNMHLNIGQDEDILIRSIQRFFKVFPEPDMTFWVDVSEEVALSRKDDILATEYLQERRALYRKLAQAFGMIALDGTMPIEDLTSTVVKIIQQKVGMTIL